MTMRKGLALFLLLTLGVSALVICFSADRSALATLLAAQKSYLALALAAILCAYGCDTGRFCLLARSMGYRITFFRGLMLTWLHYFGCAITPMQVGGGPFQVYVLYRSGVPIGSGVAVTLVRTLMSTFLLSLGAPAAFFLAPELLEGHRLVKGIFFYVVLLSALVWVVFGLSVVKPRWIKRLVGKAMMVLRGLRRFQGLPVIKWYRRLGQEVDSYSANVRRMVRRGMPQFLLAAALSVLHLLVLFSVLPLLIAAVGLPVNYLVTLSAQMLFTFILYFVPTPGGSGVAEGGGAALFTLLVPWNMAGVMAIAWRFFTEYLAIFMGAIVAIRMIGWGVAEKILSGGEQGVEDGGDEPFSGP